MGMLMCGRWARGMGSAKGGIAEVQNPKSPDQTATLSAVYTKNCKRLTCASASASSSSSFRASKALSTISSITPALHISRCIVCMVSEMPSTYKGVIEEGQVARCMHSWW